MHEQGEDLSYRDQGEDLCYRDQGEDLCCRDAVLKPWQIELIKEVYSPNDRYVIWAIGEKGNEGKTWFQKYITSIFNPIRVLTEYYSVGLTYWQSQAAFVMP